MKRSEDRMGATDRAKATKQATKANKSYTRFFSEVNKSEKPGNVRLDLSASEPPSSSALLASSTSVIPSSTTTATASITGNASANKATPVASIPTNATGTKTGASTKTVTRKNSSDSEIENSKRVKTVIMFDKKAVAVQMRSDKEPEVDPEEDALMAAAKKIKVKPLTTRTSLERQMPQLPEQQGIRTFRMWAPQQQKKAITVAIGNRKSMDEANKIFDTKEIKTRTYKEWRREAKAMLPSNMGGPPIEDLTDVLQAAPSLQKEGDPRALRNSIKRLSIDSGEKPLLKLKPQKEKVDYTKPREISWDNSEGDTKPSKSGDTILNLDESDEEEELRRERERKQAGIDIKGKISTLRQMADHLSTKRMVRHQLVGKATGHTVLDAEEIPIKEHILYAIENMGDFFHDVSNFFLIWEKHVREISGRYGVVTANYFTWSRKMVGLEILAFFLTYELLKLYKSIKSVIIIIPQIVDDITQGNTAGSTRPFQIQDIITGEGYFHHTYLYYSGYEQARDPNTLFNSPAYRFLFCRFIIFIVLTYFIFSRLTRYYQTARMESAVAGVANMDNFKTVICGWDFSCRNEQAKIYLHRTITQEMQILVKKAQHPEHIALIQIEMQRKKFLAFSVKHLGLFWGPWTVHISGSMLIIIICVLLGVLLYYLCFLKFDYYLHCVRRDDGKPKTLNHPILCPNGDEYLSTLILLMPALFSSMATLLLTKFILVIGDVEVWSTPQRKIYATMIRAGLFNFTNIVVFYTFWLRAKPELNDKGFVAETIFGKELYRLVVIQGLVDVVLTVGVQGLYHLIRRKFKNYEKSEFRTEYCCLSMFFVFSVSRIGTLFCPPLSLFVILRLIVDFYVNKFSLFHLSSHQSFSVHVSQVYGPFLLTFFVLCYLITSFMNLYYVSDTVPSNYDGPFERYNESYDEVLRLWVTSEKNTRWISYLVKEGFLIVLLSILSAALYFCYTWGAAYKPLVTHLHELISLERADRDLLLKAIFEIGQVTADDIGGRLRRRSFLVPKGAVEKTPEPTSPDEEDEFETDDEYYDHADSQIDALIRHVRKRKSTRQHDIHAHLSAHNKRHTHPPHSNQRVSHGANKHSTEDTARQAHVDLMEAIVANIVHNRRRKSLLIGHDTPNPHHSIASIATLPEPALAQHHASVSLNHPHEQHHPPPLKAQGKVVGHHIPNPLKHSPSPKHSIPGSSLLQKPHTTWTKSKGKR